MTVLHWLPEAQAWRERLSKLRKAYAPVSPEVWREILRLANSRMDFIRTNALDETIRILLKDAQSNVDGFLQIRLALLGSSTLAHLQSAIRVAGLRHGFFVSIYECAYGQYYHELVDRDSPLHVFNPNVVLFAQDAYHLTEGASVQFTVAEAAALLEDQWARLSECWQLARDAFSCQVIQNTALPVHRSLLGSNEQRLPGSGANLLYELNYRLRRTAQSSDIDLLDLDTQAAKDGLSRWHDAGLWYRAKQEISPAAAPFYGDLVTRVIGARLGRSFKCLALDLDNTLWGGVVGDDGLEGIVLGQGSALGECYVAFQRYVLELSRRGIVLAVCSKNDEAIAAEAFDRHPEMILKRKDIAVFKANWNDKATNLKEIALELNIGADAIVFLDDNPMERDWVRRELPIVAVPEVSDDPLSFPQTLADAGYFESLAVTEEDRARSQQYQVNRERLALRASAVDMTAYLKSLKMTLTWKHFDRIGLGRVVQLINKTNQFNLTTRRYTQEGVVAIMASKAAFGLQLRLVDRFGDNGVIGICIGKIQGQEVLVDTWLMSCRVLGRTVEQATLNVLVECAKRMGATRIVGEYIPTKKNAMVAEHYARLGFNATSAAEDGSSRWLLELRDFIPLNTAVEIERGPEDDRS